MFSFRPIFRFSLRWIPRKAKTFIPKTYSAIPPYMQIEKRDPHDYPLRSKEEVQESFQKLEPSYSIAFKFYEEALPVYQDMNRRVKIQFDINSLNITPKQRERMILLLGPRGKPNVTIAIDWYPTWQENFVKVQEIFDELILESLRAP